MEKRWLALGVVMLAACSTATNIANVVTVDAGAKDDDPTGIGIGVAEAGNELDAGLDARDRDGAVHCTGDGPPSSVSNDCVITTDCPSCGSRGFTYVCDGGGTRPAIEGCSTNGGAICCPAACVRWASEDHRCEVEFEFAPFAYACPERANGTKLIADAGIGCRYRGTFSGTQTGGYCCPQ